MTPAVVRLPDRLRRQLIDHCLDGVPLEACGLLGMTDDTVVTIFPTNNADRSATSYTIPPAEHFEALRQAESQGITLGGVFHSHPAGPAEMSEIDLGRALEPDWVYIVVGLGGNTPEVAAYTSDGRPVQVEIRP